MSKNKYCVYMHKNKLNGKIYVGLTSMIPEERWSNGKGYHTGHFRYAIDKYGWDNFEHIILKDNPTKTEASYWERYYIQQYNSTDRNYGYNISLGGHPQTEETRRKISENHGGFDGRKHTKESKLKMNKSSSGENHPNFGKHHSKQLKIKLSKSALKNRGRLFLCVELNKVFDNLNDVYLETTCHKGSIVQCCQGKQKQSKGYHWKYAD